ncbi:Phosphatidate cytidylyltransferase [hydrothermal vent metagenome]|uniref:Phosphatidate cytidylyltransferase n=1 Tax=hydrothermal vent metagenome TaxID=652676 RepID=A0A3B0W5C8_9ZZZZ
MLKQRILTALLLAPLVLAIIWYGNDLVFAIFTATLVLLIAFEWCQIVKNSQINSAVISLAAAISILLLNYAAFIVIDVQRIVIAATVLWLLCLFWLFRPAQGQDKYTIKYALGVAILMLFGASLISIHQIPKNGAILTLVLFFLVWVADIGAYVTGKNFGKHKLAKKISPGKTVEGLIGGLICTSIFGYFVAIWLQHEWLYFVIAFPVIAGISVIGDLFASLLKRQNNIKDSGFLLPGHGGFLDRFDSLIAATPFYFAFIHYLHVL